MATKKETETVKPEAAEAPAKAEALVTPADPWDETVEMVVPRRPKGEEQQYYICVNDRRYVIPADGKRQKLPQPVAEVLQASIDAEYAADDFADQMNRDAAEAARGL